MSFSWIYVEKRCTTSGRQSFKKHLEIRSAADLCYHSHALTTVIGQASQPIVHMPRPTRKQLRAFVWVISARNPNPRQQIWGVIDKAVFGLYVLGMPMVWDLTFEMKSLRESVPRLFLAFELCCQTLATGRTLDTSNYRLKTHLEYQRSTK